MPKEYQSEKSPIFDSQKSPKTLRKLHLMSQLYAAKVCQLFCNTRYIKIILQFLTGGIQNGQCSDSTIDNVHAHCEHPSDVEKVLPHQ